MLCITPFYSYSSWRGMNMHSHYNLNHLSQCGPDEENYLATAPVLLCPHRVAVRHVKVKPRSAVVTMLKRLDKIRFRGPRTRDDFPDLNESPPASDNECSDDVQPKPRAAPRDQEESPRDPVSVQAAHLTRDHSNHVFTGEVERPFFQFSFLLLGQPFSITSHYVHIICLSAFFFLFFPLLQVSHLLPFISLGVVQSEWLSCFCLVRTHLGVTGSAELALWHLNKIYPWIILFWEGCSDLGVAMWHF